MLKELLLKKAKGLPVVDKPVDVHRFIEARIGEVIFAVELDNVKELVGVPSIGPVPGAPFNILGIFSLRGEIVTVLDIREKFNVSNVMKTPLSRVIVISVFQELIGLFVDEAPRILDIPKSDFVEINSDAYESMFLYQVKFDNRNLGVLNIEKMYFDYKIM